MRIRELPLHEQPISRIADRGPDALSDAELLALVSGQQDLEICARSLREYHGWVGLLRADMRAVAASIGTPRRAASLKAALEIGRRLLVAGYEGRYQVKSPADVAQLFMVEMMALDQEELWVACLDTKNRLIKIAKVYRGSVNTAMIRVGEVFKEALRLNAASIVVAHNHPSSDPTPSPEDILVTRQIVEAGKLLDCECLDHLVLAGNRFASLRERGLGFPS
ncbi:MAG: DNA repair protein RadC [Chloroflexales bacterium]|nr:DNA repair protein RadC [Chloroflexales bacterium]